MSNNKINSLTEEEIKQLEKEWFKKSKVENSDIIEFKKWNVSFLSNED